MKTKKISHEDVRKAIQQFKQEGGMIAELPPQEVRESQHTVGGEKYQPYESLTALLHQ